MDRFGGRKFLALLLTLALGTAAELLAPKGLSANFVYLLLGMYGLFTAGNVGITMKSLGQLPTLTQGPDLTTSSPDDVQPNPPPEQASVDLTPVTESLSRLEAGLSQVVGAIPPQNQALQMLVTAEQNRTGLRQRMTGEFPG